MKATLAVLVAALLLAAPASAQRYGLFDAAHRTTLSASAGYLFNAPTGGSPEWKGIDAGPAVTYSLAAPQAGGAWYPPLSLFAQYVHGFPFNSADKHENRARLALNLKVYPAAPAAAQPAGKLGIAIGAGLLWQGYSSVGEWHGYEAHATGTWDLPWPWAVLYGSYSHAFTADPSTSKDFDFVGAGINCKILALK